MFNRSQWADVKVLEEKLLAITSDYQGVSVMSFETWKEFQDTGVATRNFFMYMLMILLAVPSLIALANTLSMTVIERTREIGLFRAIGTQRKQVSKMIMAESLIIACVGVVLGLVAGLALSYTLVGVMNETGFILNYYFPVSGVLVAVIVGILFSIIAAWFPARRASRFKVVEAIAYE